MVKKKSLSPAVSSGLRALAANAGYGVTSKVLTIALRLVYVVALARLLSAADYGLYIYALSWYVLFMPLTNMGQDLELARAVGGRCPDAPEVVSATFTLRIYTTVAVLAGVGTLGWLSNPGDEGRLLVLLVSLAMLPRSLAVWCQLVFITAERSRYVLVQDLRFRPLELVAAMSSCCSAEMSTCLPWCMSALGSCKPCSGYCSYASICGPSSYNRASQIGG